MLLLICSDLLKEPLMENFIFCAVCCLVKLQSYAYDLAFLRLVGRLFNESQANCSNNSLVPDT